MSDKTPAKFLIIRLSSIGDILQTMAAPNKIRAKFKNAQVHWLVKQQFSFLLQNHPDIQKVICLPKSGSLLDLLKLALQMRSEGYTHIYDAHNNTRSHIVCWFLRARLSHRPNFIKRSKERWKRFLFFKLRKPVFESPYRGIPSFMRPLAPWLGRREVEILPPPPQLYFEPGLVEKVRDIIKMPEGFITLVPSANWVMKRWPPEHWKTLIELMPDKHFLVVGGPQDDFCQQLEKVDPARVKNYAGKLSIIETCAAISFSGLTIANDTGFLHAADQLGTPAIAIFGPTALNYPSRSSSIIAETTHLPCKPCSKDGSGKCKQKVFRQCLVDLTPNLIAKKANEQLKSQEKTS